MSDDINVPHVIGRIEGKLDSLITEVKGLKDDFGTMEKGRLSKLEVAFATLSAEIEVKAKASALWMGAIMAATSSVISGIILYLILRHS